uniref:Uncharacterized protein n=1 Tax=Arundo donax TaxID=35708 RepID=A0A0A9F932_ARUDO
MASVQLYYGFMVRDTYYPYDVTFLVLFDT